MVTITSEMEISAEKLNTIFNDLKELYEVEKIDQARKQEIIELVNNYGYVPYPHIKALKELNPAETMIAIEEKLKLSGIYNNERFLFNNNEISPVKRAGFNNADWFKREQHNIKLVNLAGLGDGNSSKEPGKFIDWLKQLVILPAGKPKDGILSTTMYLIPFHPREFGCAYIPKHSGASERIEDDLLKSKLGLHVKDQIRLFIAFSQLAGHPVIYDVLPQTGRFSKIALANPYVARWFDVNKLINEIQAEIVRIKNELKLEYRHEDVDYTAELLIKLLLGENPALPENLESLFDLFEERLITEKNRLSNLMMQEETQKSINKKAKMLINKVLHRSESENITEESISDVEHGKVIEALIKEGLWPAGGGAWNSAGVPIFDKMSEGGGHPTFKHYDYQGNDVTRYANLDCQTPYYFVCLENGKYNKEVIDFYVDFLKKLQQDYNFDGFRVDHIDHIADIVSEKDGIPISYRAPRVVLGMANKELKRDIPYFAALAEYMLWDDLFKEYHEDMNFDVLWGNDIISQYQKDVARIIRDNEQLESYNSNGNSLSTLKIYNNQDGEFREINQYPGQLGEEGALFKWFKLKFIPGGKAAQRPVMFIDGDESFTKTGIEAVIGAEQSMVREDNPLFFDKFDAINRFALNNKILRTGKASLYQVNNETGFVSWFVEEENSGEKLFIVANEKAPREMTKIKNGQELCELTYVENNSIENISVKMPDGVSVAAEFVYNQQVKDFEEKTEINNLTENTLYYDKLTPSEFHVYKVYCY
ncbi:MAG TPA: hypothetical protein P5556_04050 [Candidatus Gastranaerophilales bacterium]|nr:hypothetical protein [Candidatus Gastranaerophilales bacterium]